MKSASVKDWKDSSVIKGTSYSSEDPSSVPSICSSAPVCPAPSSDILGHCTHMHIYTSRDNIIGKWQVVPTCLYPQGRQNLRVIFFMKGYMQKHFNKKWIWEKLKCSDTFPVQRIGNKPGGLENLYYVEVRSSQTVPSYGSLGTKVTVETKVLGTKTDYKHCG